MCRPVSATPSVANRRRRTSHGQQELRSCCGRRGRLAAPAHPAMMDHTVFNTRVRDVVRPPGDSALCGAGQAKRAVQSAWAGTRSWRHDLEGQVIPIGGAPAASRPESGAIGSTVHQSLVIPMRAHASQRRAGNAAIYGPETWAEFGGFEPFVDEVVIGRFLGIEPRQVLAMARAGEIPAHPIGLGQRRKRWRFRLSEVEAHFNVVHNRTGAKMQAAVPGTKERNRLG